jgi:hypothetical protein
MRFIHSARPRLRSRPRQHPRLLAEPAVLLAEGHHELAAVAQRGDVLPEQQIGPRAGAEQALVGDEREAGLAGQALGRGDVRERDGRVGRDQAGELGGQRVARRQLDLARGELGADLVAQGAGVQPPAWPTRGARQVRVERAALELVEDVRGVERQGLRGQRGARGLLDGELGLGRGGEVAGLRLERHARRATAGELEGGERGDLGRGAGHAPDLGGQRLVALVRVRAHVAARRDLQPRDGLEPLEVAQHLPVGRDHAAVAPGHGEVHGAAQAEQQHAVVGQRAHVAAQHQVGGAWSTRTGPRPSVIRWHFGSSACGICST